MVMVMVSAANLLLFLLLHLDAAMAAVPGDTPTRRCQHHTSQIHGRGGPISGPMSKREKTHLPELGSTSQKSIVTGGPAP